MKFWNGIKDQLWRILAVMIVGVLTVFSNSIVGDIKRAMNKADQQVAGYEELSEELSRFAFLTEVIVTFFDEGWTTKTALEETAAPYNESISTLRCRELLNEVMVRRYWGEAAEAEFITIMDLVKAVEDHVRKLNPEYDDVIAGKKPFADKANTDPIIAELKPLLQELQNEVSDFLHSLM